MDLKPLIKAIGIF